MWGLFSCVLSRFQDSCGDWNPDFLLRTKELQTSSDKSIKTKAHGKQVSGFSAAERAECAPREARNASAMKAPGNK